MLKKLLQYGVPLIISIGLCYLLFTGIDFNEMIETIRNECNFWWIGLALFISLFSHLFRAMRWRIQLRALNINAPLVPLVYSIFGTYAVNLVFPRLGEVWRTTYISQRQNASFTAVFGSMVADRMADTVTVLVLTLSTFLLASGAITQYLAQNTALYEKVIALISSPWLWVAFVAFIALTWWILAKKRDNKIVAKIIEFAKGLWVGFAAIAKMKGKGQWLILTFAIWGCYFIQLFVAFFAFKETTAVVENHGIIAVLVCFVFSSIAMGVPSNGGIGPWQWAVIFGLSIYGLPTNGISLAFANLVLGSQTILLIILGIYTFAAIALEKRRNAPLKS
ncbi:MAG: flippase-like domain-containing protein [Muribaculaceae bacterium]|nr:flippase-like domain-containing protein [Muribaculaceae bacterium]